MLLDATYFSGPLSIGLNPAAGGNPVTQTAERRSVEAVLDLYGGEWLEALLGAAAQREAFRMLRDGDYAATRGADHTVTLTPVVTLVSEDGDTLVSEDGDRLLAEVSEDDIIVCRPIEETDVEDGIATIPRLVGTLMATRLANPVVSLAYFHLLARGNYNPTAIGTLQPADGSPASTATLQRMAWRDAIPQNRRFLEAALSGGLVDTAPAAFMQYLEPINTLGI